MNPCQCMWDNLKTYFNTTFNIMYFSLQFVYVIEIYAVHFGNNWMKKIPRTAKLDKYVVLLPINYIASQSIQRKHLCPERKSLQ